jgi:hypothetical protein
MTEYLSRDAWDARDSEGAQLLDRDEVAGIAVHWPGTTDRHTTQADVAEALRGWQDYHMDGRGWSDIAYQVAVDQAGRAWTLRGLGVRSAANGDADVNRRYGALLLVLAVGEQPSAAMLATARAVVADFRARFPDGQAIRPHSAVRPEGTDCPGDLVRAAIARGDLTPRSDDEGDIDMASAATIEQKLDGLARVLGLRYDVETDRYVVETARWNAEQQRWEAETDRDAAEMGMLAQIAAAVGQIQADVKAIRADQSAG